MPYSMSTTKMALAWEIGGRYEMRGDRGRSEEIR